MSKKIKREKVIKLCKSLRRLARILGNYNNKKAEMVKSLYIVLHKRKITCQNLCLDNRIRFLFFRIKICLLVRSGFIFSPFY